MEQIPAPLKGKVALVTGGSRGIGAGIVLKLAEQGCTHIAITYKDKSNKSEADEVLTSIRQISPSIKTHAFAANLLDENFGPNVVEQTLAGLETDYIDIVIANAVSDVSVSMSPVSQISRTGWTSGMTANAWANFDLARSAVLKMPPGGRIIMISSAASKLAYGEEFFTYATSKAALESMSKNLAAAWGVKYGITVNAISVGATLTDSLRMALEQYGEEFARMTREISFLKRQGEVEEVASIVAFVASPGASWIIGNLIPANGGHLAVLQGYGKKYGHVSAQARDLQ